MAENRTRDHHCGTQYYTPTNPVRPNYTPYLKVGNQRPVLSKCIEKRRVERAKTVQPKCMPAARSGHTLSQSVIKTQAYDLQQPASQPLLAASTW